MLFSYTSKKNHGDMSIVKDKWEGMYSKKFIQMIYIIFKRWIAARLKPFKALLC